MKKAQSKSNLFLIMTMVALVVVAAVFIKSRIVTPNVSEIQSNKVAACSKVVTSFSASGYCGNGKVKTVTFTCANGKGSGIDGVKDCIDPVSAYKFAQDFCTKACAGLTVKPVPAPSSISSTCTCPKGVKCKLPAYCNPAPVVPPPIN